MRMRYIPSKVCDYRAFAGAIFNARKNTLPKDA
jgi:hypothetical protein